MNLSKVFDMEPREDVFDLCNKWFKLYEKAYEEYSELANSKDALAEGYLLRLVAAPFKDNLGESKMMTLSLKKDGKEIKNGPVLLLSDKNEAIYKYLFARVVSHYINTNYKNTPVDVKRITYNWLLTEKGDAKNKPSTKEAYIINVCNDDSEYGRIVLSIICCHNANDMFGLNRIISDLAKNITEVDKIYNNLSSSIKASNILLETKSQKTR